MSDAYLLKSSIKTIHLDEIIENQTSVLFLYTDENNDDVEYRPTKGMMNVNLRNADSETPLHLAAYNGTFKSYSVA